MMQHIWEFLRWFWPPWLWQTPTHSDVTNGLFIVKMWLNAWLLVGVYLPFVTITLYALLRDRKDCSRVTLAEVYNWQNWKDYPFLLWAILCYLCWLVAKMVDRIIAGFVWLKNNIGNLPMP